MEKYSAGIEYNEKTLELLSGAVSGAFDFGRRLIFSLLGVILIVLGVFYEDRGALGLITLIVGCFVFTGIRAPARLRAKANLRSLRGGRLSVRYSFNECGFDTVTDFESSELCYSELIRLVDDKQYLYLFASRQSAYMIDKATITSCEALPLREFLSERSGLAWTRPRSLLSFSFGTVFKNTKRK